MTRVVSNEDSIATEAPVEDSLSAMLRGSNNQTAWHPLIETPAGDASGVRGSTASGELVASCSRQAQDHEQQAETGTVGSGPFEDRSSNLLTERKNAAIEHGTTKCDGHATSSVQSRSETDIVLHFPMHSVGDTASSVHGVVGLDVRNRFASKADTIAASVATPLLLEQQQHASQGTIFRQVRPRFAAEVLEDGGGTCLNLKIEGGYNASRNSLDISTIQHHCLPFINLLQELLDVAGLTSGDGSDAKPQKHQEQMDGAFGEAAPMHADVITRLVTVLLKVGHYKEELLALLLSHSLPSDLPVGCAAKPQLSNLSDGHRAVGSFDFRSTHQNADSEVAAATSLSSNYRSKPSTISCLEMAAGSHEASHALLMTPDTVSRPKEGEDVEQEEEREKEQKIHPPSELVFANSCTTFAKKGFAVDTFVTAESTCVVNLPSTDTRQHATASSKVHSQDSQHRSKAAVNGNGITGTSDLDATQESHCVKTNHSSADESECHGSLTSAALAKTRRASTAAGARTAVTDNMAAFDDEGTSLLRTITNANANVPKKFQNASTAADEATCSSDRSAPEAARAMTRAFKSAACIPSSHPVGRGRGRCPGNSGAPLKASSGGRPVAGRGRGASPSYFDPGISSLSSLSSGRVLAPPTNGDGGICCREGVSDSALRRPDDAVRKITSLQGNESSDPGQVATASCKSGRAAQYPSPASTIRILAVASSPSSSRKHIHATCQISCSYRRLQEIPFSSHFGDCKFAPTLTLLWTERLNMKCFAVAVTRYGFLAMATDKGLYLCQYHYPGSPELVLVYGNSSYQCLATAPFGADSQVIGSVHSECGTVLVAGNKASRSIEVLVVSGTWPALQCTVAHCLLSDNLPWCIAVDKAGCTTAVGSGRCVHTVALDGSSKHSKMPVGYTVSALAYGSLALVIGSSEPQDGRYSLQARAASSIDRQLWTIWLDEAVSGLQCESHCYVLLARSQALRIVSVVSGIQLAEVALSGLLPRTAFDAYSRWHLFLLGDVTPISPKCTAYN